MAKSTATNQPHANVPNTDTGTDSTACPTRDNEMALREKSTLQDEVPDGGFAA